MPVEAAASVGGDEGWPEAELVSLLAVLELPAERLFDGREGELATQDLDEYVGFELGADDHVEVLFMRPVATWLWQTGIRAIQLRSWFNGRSIAVLPLPPPAPTL